MNGVFFINKPQGMSSFAVLRKIKHHLADLSGVKPKTIKIGHAGTLDPAASGLLLVCVGHATKISSYLMRDEKIYSLDVVLGQQTDTDDAEGDVVFENDQRVSFSDLEKVCKTFLGETQQLPPNFSAIKIKGKKLYEYARKGQAVERVQRTVTVKSLDIVEYSYPVAKIRVRCSKGTYMRALARDVGEMLGTGGHAKNIHREQNGEFNLKEALSLEAFLLSPYENLCHELVSLEIVLAGLPRLSPFDKQQVKALMQGRFLINASEAGEYVLRTQDDKVFALGEVNNGQLKIKRALQEPRDFII